jgi:hypothetical protein
VFLNISLQKNKVVSVVSLLRFLVAFEKGKEA